MKKLFCLILCCSNLLFSAAPPEHGIIADEPMMFGGLPSLPLGVDFIQAIKINRDNMTAETIRRWGLVEPHFGYFFIFKYGGTEILVTVFGKNVYNGTKPENRVEGLDSILTQINYCVWKRAPHIFPHDFSVVNPAG